MRRPKIVGIVNITEDSFSDGGRFLATEDALDHAAKLVSDGADIIELGPASSNPDASPVPAHVQIARLEPVLKVLRDRHVPVSVDATTPAVQEFALASGAAFINDIRGFAAREAYPALAGSHCGLIIMHSVSGGETARRIDTDPLTIFDMIVRFFEQRLSLLASQGLASDRVVLDPGMGFFLGTDPEVSLTVLRNIAKLRMRFGLPVMISVSRKSFLRKLTDRTADGAGGATLAAELFAWEQGVDYIRTHDPGALHDAINVLERLRS